MFAYHPASDGQAATPIERQATCECGRTFTQSLMAPRELAAMERMGHIATFMRSVPECFVPVHCPPCERADLSRQARIDEGRALSAERATASNTVPDRRAS
jgi:hypothetical protein